MLGISEKLKALGDAWQRKRPRLGIELQERDKTRRQGLHSSGGAPATLRLLELVERIAPTDYPVLITGEVATGKSLLARHIHLLSWRKHGPFVTVDVAVLIGGTATSELFGHRRGSFTGAVQDRPGLVRSAEDGTLYLDGIEGAPLEIQAALLRFADSGELFAIGGDRPLHVDVRLVASTSSDPFTLAAEGRVRRDLFARLSTLQLHIPPLRERREDIPILTEHFLAELRTTLEVKSLALTQEALDALEQYDFPGNVRGLRSVIQGAAIVAQDETITPDHLRLRSASRPTPAADVATTSSDVQSLRREIEYLRKTTIPAQPI